MIYRFFCIFFHNFQAPKSMKSVVQSFWLLTTCVGNIIDIFLVEIKLAPTQVKFEPQIRLFDRKSSVFKFIQILIESFQSGEYFILALIMLGSSSIFILLSIFYYQYIPEDAFALDEAQDAKDAAIENVALEVEDEKNEKFEKAETEKTDESVDL